MRKANLGSKGGAGENSCRTSGSQDHRGKLICLSSFSDLFLTLPPVTPLFPSFSFPPSQPAPERQQIQNGYHVLAKGLP